MRLGAVLLAAGLSRRFGAADKLLCGVAGEPMAAHAMDVLLASGAERCAVVASGEGVAALAAARGLTVIVNGEPERGLSRSIALGVQAMAQMDAVLLLVADQPLLTAASVRRLVQGFAASGAHAACLKDETHWGNPAVFSAACYGALLALQGDRGARAVLRAQGDALLLVPCLRRGELADADTPQALAALPARDGGTDARQPP